MSYEVCDYIDDGYNEKGYVKKLENVHGEFRFEFRPMPVMERQEIIGAVNKISDPEYAKLMANAAIDRMASWSLKKRGTNSPLPCTLDWLTKLKPQLFWRVVDIITGFAASDTDPQWTEAEKAEALRVKTAAAIANRPPGDVAAEEREGN